MRVLVRSPYWLTIEHAGGVEMNYHRPEGRFFTSHVYGRRVKPAPFGIECVDFSDGVSVSLCEPSVAVWRGYFFQMAGSGPAPDLRIGKISNKLHLELVAIVPAPAGFQWSLLHDNAEQSWSIYAQRDIDALKDRPLQPWLIVPQPRPGTVTLYLKRVTTPTPQVTP